MEPNYKAGRELDALIAERFDLLPGSYSTVFYAAWLIVEEFEHVELMRNYGHWSCELCCLKTQPAGIVSPGFAEADTPALAICLAALKAVSCSQTSHQGDQES